MTGATGFVGRIVVAGLRDAGWEVVPITRSKLGGEAPAGAGAQARHVDLAEPVDPSALAGLDALVHAAWDLAATRPSDIWRVNVAGSVRLLAAARAAGVRRVLFVSSMSAYEGTRQLYGTTKLAVEAVATGLGGAVVRLGLVYGPAGSDLGGMAGALARMAALPVTPLVAASARQFTVHQDDVRAAVPRLLAEAPPVPVGLAHPDPVAFRDLLQGLARRRCRFVPVPWPAVYGSLRVAEAVGIPVPFRSDSLLGLVRPAPSVSNQALLESLGVRPRPFAP